MTDRSWIGIGTKGHDNPDGTHWIGGPPPVNEKETPEEKNERRCAHIVPFWKKGDFWCKPPKLEVTRNKVMVHKAFYLRDSSRTLQATNWS